MKLRILSLMSMLFAILIVGSLQAQVTTSAISGIIKNSKGEGLEGATVVAVHAPTGTSYRTTTRKGGRYDLQNVNTGGPYKFTVTFVGMLPFESTDLILQLGQTGALDITMAEIGEELSAVVVTAAGRRNTGLKTGASSNFDEKLILELPNISRSLTNITTLTPQAGGGNSFGGRDGRYNNIQIDGANFNNNFGLSSNPLPGGASQPISLDAISEINVVIAPYDVRQANFTGAGINATTRRGTNQFSGSAYTFFRNEGFIGRDAVGKNIPSVVPSKSNTYGARLGGPIIKNKLFFFVNAETEKRDAPGLVWEADRGQAPGPNTSRTLASDLDRVSDFLRTNYNYETGPYENLGNFFTQSDKILGRLDWNINSKHSVSLRYNYMKGTDDQATNGTSAPNPRAASSRWSRNSMSYQNSLYNFTNTVESFAGEIKSRFTNNLSNQFLATYTKIVDERGSGSTPFPFVDIQQGGDAYLSFGYELFSFQNRVENKVLILTNNLSYNVGKHAITAGISYENQNVLNGFLRYGTSYYRFASIDDFLTNKAPSAYGLTYPFPGQQPFADLTFGQASAYVQDEYRVSDKFKLTYGVRFDQPLFLNDLSNNPGIDALNFRNLNGSPLNIDVSKWPKERLLVSPRIGFNWDVNGDRSLVVRGGTGIFTGRLPFVWFTNQPTNSGVIQNTVELTSNNASQAAILANIRFRPEADAWQNLFPATPSTLPPGSIASVDQDFRMPVVLRTSAGFDKKLGDDYTLTVEAIYNKDINALFQYNANQNAPVGQLSGPDNRPLFTSATRRLNANINEAMVLTNTNKGWATVATVQLKKRFSKNWDATIAYNFTYSTELSGNPGAQAASAWSNILSTRGNNNLGLSLSDFATPHRVVAYVTYRKEFLKHLGTSLSLVYTGFNQNQFSYRYSNDLNGDGISSDLLYIPKDASEITFATNGTFTPQQQSDAFFAYVDQDKYLSNHKGQYAERNGGTFPWFSNLDFRLLQDVFTTLGKNNRRHTVQFSAEVENFTNMISSDWGVSQRLVYNNGAILSVASTSGGPGGRPTFRMNTVNGALPTSTFESVININQTWRMNLGFRYSF